MRKLLNAVLLVAIVFVGYAIYIKQSGIFPSVDPNQKLAEFVNRKKWGSVKLYAEFILKHPSLGDTTAAREYLNRANEEINKAHTWKGRARSFVRGLVTGEPRNLDEFLGSLTLDMFVIGDIRDLINQLVVKPIKKEKPDPFITALAAVGIATTTIPELDISASVMKMFKKLKIFTKRFAKVLEEVARESLKTRKFKGIREILGDFGRILRKIDIAPTSDIMKFVNDTRDMKKVARMVEKEPIETYGVLVTTDGKAIKSLEKESKSASKLAKSLEKTARVAKITKIGYKFLFILPLWSLYLIVLILLSLLALINLPTIRKFAKKKSAFT